MNSFFNWFSTLGAPILLALFTAKETVKLLGHKENNWRFWVVYIFLSGIVTFHWNIIRVAIFQS